jgi:hypothetical protein
MTPQPVQIYGVPCVLQRAQNRGGALTSYTVTHARSGAVLASHAARLMAVARAAEALRGEPRK